MSTRKFSILLVILATVCLTVGWALANKTIVIEPLNHRSTLAAPTLTVANAGTKVTLSWSAVSGATGYTLFYAPHPYTGPETIGSVDMGGQTGISANLSTGASFYIAVQAYNSAGSSGYSNIEHFVISNSSGWSRIIPDTSDGVYVWADQLQTYNDSQNQFVATNFVGSQKLTKDRQYRLAWLLLRDTFRLTYA